MIDERHLTTLLDEVAEGYEPPAGGPDAVLATARAADEGRTARAGQWLRWRPQDRRRWAVVVTFVVLVGISVAGFVSRGGERPASEVVARGSRFVGGGETSGGPSDGDTSSDAATDVAASGFVGGTGETTGGSVGGGATGRVAAGQAAPGPLPQAGADTKVVKTGSVEVEVAKGRFGAAVSRVTGLATGLNGFVAESSTAEDKGGSRGQVTIRVPAANFEQALTEVRRLGEVRHAVVKGQDVTAEFTDLEARLRTLQTTRDQFLALLRQAKTIPDILGVQDRVNQTQLEIEQTQGRLHLLTDQTSFGTLAVTLFEKGGESPTAPAGRGGLAQAWHDAREGFVDGIEAVVAGSGTGLFVLLVLLALGLGARGAWRLARRRLV